LQRWRLIPLRGRADWTDDSGLFTVLLCTANPAPSAPWWTNCLARVAGAVPLIPGRHNRKRNIRYDKQCYRGPAIDCEDCDW